MPIAGNIPPPHGLGDVRQFFANDERFVEGD
jgi:hypothetical protein